MKKISKFILNITGNKWSPMGAGLLMILIALILMLMSSCGVQSNCPYDKTWQWSSSDTLQINNNINTHKYKALRAS
tara:strand:+ start:759 stop:986 length:228 start_codon:yes stop_codon:yes gene_type:complete